jgi:hypothetical protein
MASRPTQMAPPITWGTGLMTGLMALGRCRRPLGLLQRMRRARGRGEGGKERDVS